MHKLSPVHAYRREGKLRLIELRLSNIDQFFNLSSFFNHKEHQLIIINPDF
jgi:hypothetical protein